MRQFLVPQIPSQMGTDLRQERNLRKNSKKKRIIFNRLLNIMNTVPTVLSIVDLSIRSAVALSDRETGQHRRIDANSIIKTDENRVKLFLGSGVYIRSE